MFKQKSIYFLGVALLLLGLLWLHSGHLLHNSEMSKIEHMENEGHNVDLGFSLIGLFPTLLGIFLIDKHNRSLSRH